ncbi:MAG: VPDSG-CTERM sorting domain-containing protein [Chthoniobacterales bacterium]|nr:VPDSG-CTERM sorting domain-containing protein [Chthoniobacterales bacterium]
MGVPDAGSTTVLLGCALAVFLSVESFGTQATRSRATSRKARVEEVRRGRFVPGLSRWGGI